MEGLLELIDPMSMLLYAANFLLLFFVARHFLYKPVTKFIAQRARLMQDAQDEIEQGREEIAEAKRNQKSDYETYLAKGEVEVNQRLSLADENARSIIVQAKDEAEQVIERARVSATEETIRARENLREEISSLSMKLAERILEREVKKADHEKLIDNFLDQIGG